MGRVIGGLVVILVLFAIISNPQGSATSTRNGASTLGSAGSQVVVFLNTLVADLSSGTVGSAVNQTSYPRGGVATGDGSTEIPG